VSERDDEAPDQAARDRAARDEAAWREIVDHFGEPPVVPEPVQPSERRLPAQPVEPPAEPFRLELYDETFVPPPMPPAPETTPERRAAWACLIGAPALLLVLALVHFALPGILTAALIVAALGSFGYLVATMSTDPRDPDDDGARL
jgi:hypothetical protein